MTQTRSMLFISHSSRDKDWANRTHEALRRKGYGVFLDSHPDDGIHPGAKWERTLWRRLSQSGGVVVLCSASWLSSPWCVAEAMIAREQGKKIFLLATGDVANGGPINDSKKAAEIPQIPDFLKDTQFISLASLTEEEAYRRLWQGLEKEIAEDFPVLGPPYPGLEPFKERDAAVFFGRRAEIQEVLAKLNKRRGNNAKGFMLILGASGCGKSSLVRAGVLPQLKGASEEDGWIVLPPFFGLEGLEGLVRSFAKAFGDTDQPETSSSIRRRLLLGRPAINEPEHHITAFRELTSDLLSVRRMYSGFLLLVIDQLEEIFHTHDKSDARVVLRLLLDVSADFSSKAVVLATMRSDFLDDFQQFEGAAERYEKVIVDPMQKAHFGEIIEGPAQRCGLQLEPGLSARLVEDTQYDDALPLLAFTLKELYEESGEDRLLTLEAYETLFPAVQVRRLWNGTISTEQGVSAAIKHVADRVLEDTGYQGLSQDDQRMRDLRNAFYRLVQVGQEGQFTRRIALRSEMPDSCSELIERLLDERLLVSGAEPNTIMVAHEALFRVWDTLQNWLVQDRDALMLRRQISRAANNWDHANRDEYLRWSEERIVDTVQTLVQSGVAKAHPLEQLERDFLGPLNQEEILETLENRSLTLVKRARLGVRLELIGDRRPGVGLDDTGIPELAWCDVPPGNVDLRDMSEEEWEPLVKELSRLRGGSVPDPASNVSARKLTSEECSRYVETFQISKYLITWAQFNAFVEARDYDAPEWWIELEKATNVQHISSMPTNHPATHMTWYQAVAFCRWLSAHLGYDLRLPTEFEWQQAATGGDPQRLFPWGGSKGELGAIHANTFEGRAVSRTHLTPTTTAVGIFPQGGSPVGAHDMSGNAWEWCDSYYEGETTSSNQRSSRVVRGGSWIIGIPACSTVYAGQLDPSADSFYVGFRPVRSVREG
jgi:formylglycine-generating enzyme required for sulfatase activity